MGEGQLRVHSCLFVVSSLEIELFWAVNCRILTCDPVAEAAATLLPRNVNRLRGYFCRAARCNSFSQPCARPSVSAEPIPRPIHLYDNSIIHRPRETDSRRIEKETDSRTISRDPAMRHRTTISQSILGQSQTRNLCGRRQRRTSLYFAR